MTESLITSPADGWTVDDMDALPEGNQRHELTDGALIVSPSPSGLHQTFAMRLGVHLESVAPEPLVVTQAVEVRFGRRLTRIPDVPVVRTPVAHFAMPPRHWFSPAEVLLAVEIESPGSHVEGRVTKPALYARHGVPHFWRVELDGPLVTTYGIGSGDAHRVTGAGDHITATEPFEVDVALAELLPRWATRPDLPER